MKGTVLVTGAAGFLGRHAYDYWLWDHVYDTRSLARTGYAVRHPDPRIGIRETVDWYQRKRWLP